METDDAPVNYIRHLSEVFIRFEQVEKLSAYHISLYMTLFQVWNMQRFQNPFMVYRSEIMALSRIGSKSTYHRCLCELAEFGFLKYFPSKNAFIGSKIEILTFEFSFTNDNSKNNFQNSGSTDVGHPSPIGGTDMGQPCPMGGTDVGQPCPTGGHQKEPLYKHNKHIKHINLFMSQKEFCEPQRKKNKKVIFEIPKLEMIADYFKAKNHNELEAQKFFNHYESNGWKVGGRTPMKNWQAAANNWMINAQKFNPPPLPTNNLHVNQDKKYDIPL